MTNDEKAKAYDMALEAARKELDVDRKEWELVERVLRNIFPELRESEDENLKNRSGYYKAGKFWKASTLWNAVKGKSPQKVPNRYILQECTWNISSLQHFADEVKNVQEVNLDYPIILDMNGNILDGAHRVVKAYLEDKDIDIVYLGDDEWPEPDYDEEKAVKKSEDERIRKELIEFLQCSMYCDDLDTEKIKRWVAYLEKQKEHVPENEESGTRKEQKLPEREGVYYYDGNGFYWIGAPATEENPYDFAMSQQEKQKEQKPHIEICPHSIKSKSYRENGVPTEPISDELIDIIKGEFEGFRTLLKKKGIDYEPQRSYWEAFARLFDSSAKEYVKEQKSTSFNEPYNPDDYEVVMEGNATSLKRKEQKPVEWNEEKERVIKDAIYALEEVGGYPCIVKELKSLRFTKQEWSEEDEKMRYFVTEAVQSRYSDRELAKYLDLKIINEKKRLEQKLFDWLRDLRPSWKPSEEQMRALDKAIPVCMGVAGKDECSPLISLYEQLKKLM